MQSCYSYKVFREKRRREGGKGEERGKKEKWKESCV